jgi:hypothetical protein
MARISDIRTLFILLASRDVGQHLYKWGGESSIEGGYDCSGYVCDKLTELSRFIPEVYDGERRTASGLLNYLNKVSSVPSLDWEPGTIVFYGTADQLSHGQASHVAIHAFYAKSFNGMEVGNVGFEAGGAGSNAVSPRAALVSNATIRMTASDVHGTLSCIGKDLFKYLQTTGVLS